MIFARIVSISPINNNVCKSNKYNISQMKMKVKHHTKQSDSDSDGLSEDLNLDKIKKPHIHRVLNFEPNFNQILINLAFTKYNVVHEVAKDLNWLITEDKKEGKWDVCWTDIPIRTDSLIRMHFYQKINYIPGMEELARKNLLGLNLNAIKRIHPEEYDFFPLTWMLPDMYSEFRRFMLTQTKKNTVFIAKPQASSQGNGIFLSNRIEDFENGEHYVIQKYITDPFLIQGLKFDLRLYVLIGGVNPLRVYLYKEGLARFATQKYKPPNNKNFKSKYTHLTNYAINKRNPLFQFNKSAESSTGHKRSYRSVIALMKRLGTNTDVLECRIKDVVIKTIISGIPSLNHKYMCSQPEQYNGNMCFHVLGFDILIDSMMNPIVLQVNHTPSFTTDSPLDKKIKYEVIRDTLILMNINQKTKQDLYLRSKAYNDRRIQTGKRQILNLNVRATEISKAQAARDQYQKNNLGGYQMIFPSPFPHLQSKYTTLCQSVQHSYKLKNQHIILNQTLNQNGQDKYIKLVKKSFSRFQGLKLGPIFGVKHDKKLINQVVAKNNLHRTYDSTNISLKRGERNICNRSSIQPKKEGVYLPTKLFDPSNCQFRVGVTTKKSAELFKLQRSLKQIQISD